MSRTRSAWIFDFIGRATGTTLPLLIASTTLATERISVTHTGAQADGYSTLSAISADGRFVAFASMARNIFPGDTNTSLDVLLMDRETRSVRCASTSSGGILGNAFSDEPSISVDGRYVAFASLASNLVPGDTNGAYDVFVKDMQTGLVEVVSVSDFGELGNAYSLQPSISADGRFVAFKSRASNLVAGDTNDHYDIFVRDRAERKTIRISLRSDGQQFDSPSNTPKISADGRYVAFAVGSSNNWAGVDIYVYNMQQRTITLESRNRDGQQARASQPSISGDGRFVAFLTSNSRMVDGIEGNSQVQCVVRDRQTGRAEYVSLGKDGNMANAHCSESAISSDGRRVAFVSGATNLVMGDANGKPDVFVRDRQEHRTMLVSVSSEGAQAKGASQWPALSSDGRFVSFTTSAANLVPDDTNALLDIFLRQL